MSKFPNLTKMPHAIITTEASAHSSFDWATADFLRQAGADVQWVQLHEHGIRGNGHLCFLETNSDAIASLIDQWIQAKVPETRISASPLVPDKNARTRSASLSRLRPSPASTTAFHPSIMAQLANVHAALNDAPLQATEGGPGRVAPLRDDQQPAKPPQARAAAPNGPQINQISAQPTQLGAPTPRPTGDKWLHQMNESYQMAMQRAADLGDPGKQGQVAIEPTTPRLVGELQSTVSCTASKVYQSEEVACALTPEEMDLLFQMPKSPSEDTSGDTVGGALFGFETDSLLTGTTPAITGQGRPENVHDGKDTTSVSKPDGGGAMDIDDSEDGPLKSRLDGPLDVNSDKNSQAGLVGVVAEPASQALGLSQDTNAKVKPTAAASQPSAHLTVQPATPLPQPALTNNHPGADAQSCPIIVDAETKAPQFPLEKDMFQSTPLPTANDSRTTALRPLMFSLPPRPNVLSHGERVSPQRVSTHPKFDRSCPVQREMSRLQPSSSKVELQATLNSEGRALQNEQPPEALGSLLPPPPIKPAEASLATRQSPATVIAPRFPGPGQMSSINPSRPAGFLPPMQSLDARPVVPAAGPVSQLSETGMAAEGQTINTSSPARKTQEGPSSLPQKPPVSIHTKTPVRKNMPFQLPRVPILPNSMPNEAPPTPTPAGKSSAAAKVSRGKRKRSNGGNEPDGQGQGQGQGQGSASGVQAGAGNRGGQAGSSKRSKSGGPKNGDCLTDSAAQQEPAGSSTSAMTRSQAGRPSMGVSKAKKGGRGGEK